MILEILLTLLFWTLVIVYSAMYIRRFKQVYVEGRRPLYPAQFPLTKIGLAVFAVQALLLMLAVAGAAAVALWLEANRALSSLLIVGAVAAPIACCLPVVRALERRGLALFSERNRDAA